MLWTTVATKPSLPLLKVLLHSITHNLHCKSTTSSKKIAVSRTSYIFLQKRITKSLNSKSILKPKGKSIKTGKINYMNKQTTAFSVTVTWTTVIIQNFVCGRKLLLVQLGRLYLSLVYQLFLSRRSIFEQDLNENELTIFLLAVKGLSFSFIKVNIWEKDTAKR